MNGLNDIIGLLDNRWDEDNEVESLPTTYGNELHFDHLDDDED